MFKKQACKALLLNSGRHKHNLFLKKGLYFLGKISQARVKEEALFFV
jgi:hypothetical protein